MEGSDSDVEENLGILQPTFLQQIKKILSEYRNDIQIIKEVIQNADDAGATEVKILYQGKSINRELPEETKFRKFLRAPALVFYNDSVFTKDDWKNIRSIYTSDKAQDPLKIGRFGLGFKSIFHMTDFPTIISGDRTMFINPSEQDQNKICTSIRLKNLKRSRNLRLSEFLDVFEGTFGFHEEMLDPGHIPATIFFFPLRLRESPLSDTIYSESEVSALLESFVVESDKNILFAKTVSKIQVFVDNVDRDVLDSTQLVHCSFGKDEAAYSIEINNEPKTLIPERKEMNKRLTAIGKTIPDMSEHWTFDVSVVSNRRLKNGETKKSRSRWLIVNYLKGGQLSERTQTLLKDEDLSYHHIVGIATRLKETDEEQMSADTGRVFCYQPLPLENHTGLPILVNAFFALGNNRRQIKWEDEGDSKMLTDKERDWNHALLSEFLPFGYHELFSEVIKLSKRNNNKKCFVQSVHNILPVLQNTDEKWKVLGNTFLEHAKNDDMFFTETEGGHWLNAKEAILLSEREAFMDTISQLLILDQANVVLLPQIVVSSLNDTAITFCKISPHFLGNHMLHHMSYKEMSRQQKEHLLQYLKTESSFDLLIEHLELLPLADDSYTCFGGTKQIFLESGDVIELFPGMFSYFVYSNLLPETSDIMKDIVETDKQRVKALDAENAALMLENILTVNFRRGTFVTLNDVETPKWKHWIERIWKFIQLRFTDSISVFESLPIFPFSFKPEWETADEINLCSLSSMLMFFPQCTEKKEAESISQAFKLMSVNIVRNVPNFIHSGFVSKYITDERAVSLLQLLARIGTKEIEHFNCKVDGDQQEAFLGYLSRTLHMDLTPGCLHVLKNLRMFKQYNSTEDKDFRLVSAHENKTVFQGNMFPVEFYKPMITISSKADPSLAVKLGAEIVDDKQHVIGILKRFGTKLHTSAEIQTLMTWVLRNAEMRENQEITTLAKETSFVESECGLWKRPSELFDPNDKLISRLFQNEGLFPKTTEHIDVQIIQGLLHLGMRTRETIKAVDIERTCEIINKNAEETSAVNEEKAVALLEFLNRYPKLVNRNFLWDKNVICVRNTAPEYVIECKNSQSTNNLCQPSNIKSSQYKYLIESVCFTIDCTALQNVAEKLGWLQPPEVKDVIKHFETVVRRYNSTMKSSSISMITKIYEWFAKRQRQGDAVNTQLLQTFSEQNNKFIWNGDFFVSPEEIYTEASEDDLDLHQFAYKLPMELKHLSDFFLSLGCASHQHLQMYLNTLSRINNEASPKPCNSSSLRQVTISVLNKLAEKHLDDVKGLNLCFPIQQSDSTHLMMKPANECTFFEASCLESFTAGNYEIVHKDVPISTAKALGVPSITQQMLSESDFFEEWGQEENLTIRIRNLIKHGYEDGFTVIKELFQNADDAGASTFCMMYDERENKDARNNLISDRMSECQGPALWVYNDAMFSEEDFINIRKLGIGTKQEYAGKTGKFGQGFCAVYNITDVPSLVSGSSMVIFDPHTSYLEKILPKGGPGIRIDFSKTRQRDVLHTFSNQFKPYENMFGCSINSEQSFYFPGTLFRLPLRARASDISDTIYTKTAVKEFMDSIMKNSSNMLLFTQNTKAIKLYHLRDSVSNPTDAKLLFEVDARKHDVREGHDQQNYTHVVKDVCERKKNEILESQPLKQLQEINICTRIYEDVCYEQKNVMVEWLVAWATGTDATFLQTSYGHKELLPLGSVAVPVVKYTELIAGNQEIKYEIKK